MRYGYFDNANREYVIDKVNLPAPWTNYIGVKDMCAVLSQNAGGYLFYKSPQYHRVTRFRPNAPLDRPGHYVYLRDDTDGDYWSVSWQPVAKPLDEARYECRHGLSYSKYSCTYKDIEATQTIFIPVDDAVELWDVRIKNTGDTPRQISAFSYIEWSFHQIEMDNQNFQMSLYASGSSYKDGCVEYDLYYEEDGYQWFGASFTPDSYDSVRESFMGDCRDESRPLAVEKGVCSNYSETTGNHCAALHRKLILAPGQELRMVYMLGEGKVSDGAALRQKYSDVHNVDAAFAQLAAFWDDKLSQLQINTPNEDMNTSLNIWNLYQSEVNIMFSRFASFIEVGGRVGLGYRDTAQDSMTVPHSNPAKCRQRIIELLRGLTSMGYGLHLFQPEWFDPALKGNQQSFKSPTVVPTPDKSQMIHGIKDTCSDDALWLIPAICEFIKETGEMSLLDEVITYADEGEGTVYEHMMRILDFSAEQVGATGICKGLRADWNDCLNLGGGESAMVSFLHHWALVNFLELCAEAGKQQDVAKYTAMRDKVCAACEDNLWDGKWYIRGITASGRKIGCQSDAEGKVHMESNTWAVLSGVADYKHGVAAMDAVDEYLYTDYGLMLNAPSFTVPDDEIGFVTRVYPGIKENGAVFSHPNPWAWCAEAMLGRGDRAMKFYNALLPVRQNDIIETRQAEPYAYCQFIVGVDHTAHGRARHPFMTGSGGWAYFAATRYMLGLRPGYSQLTVDPCIPAAWDGFTATRKWRGATYNITVENPTHVCKGIEKVLLNGKELATATIPMQPAGSVSKVTVVMG